MVQGLGHNVENLKLNAKEQDFVKQLYVGYYVKSTDINIPIDRIMDIMLDINMDLITYSDNYMVFDIPEGYLVLAGVYILLLQS